MTFRGFLAAGGALEDWAAVVLAGVDGGGGGIGGGTTGGATGETVTPAGRGNVGAEGGAALAEVRSGVGVT